VLAAALLAGRGASGDPPATAEEARARVDAWLRAVASNRYEEREQARAELKRWAASLADLLEPHRDHVDPEVRRAVREALGEAATEDPPAVPEARVDFSALGLVTLDARGPLEGVFRVLGRQLEAHFDLPGGYAARAAEAHLAGVPAFQALEVVAEGVGLSAAGGFDAGGTLRLEERGASTERVPTSAVGPLRLRALRVTRSRALGQQSRGLVSLALAVDAVPSVELVWFRSARVERAIDAAGGTHREAPGGASNVTFGGGASLAVSLEPVDATGPGSGERLSELELVLPVRLRHGRKWVRFKALHDLPRTISPAPGEQGSGDPGAGGGSVTLHALDRPERGVGTWAVEVRARLEGEVPPKSLRLALEEPDGARTLLVGSRSTTADGTVHLSGRGARSASAGAAAVVVQWFVREEEGEVRFRLTDVPLR
jgi:hypothetical protein